MSKGVRLARILDATGLAAAFRAAGAWSGLLVLNYHRVGDGGSSQFDRGLWSASGEGFDAQLSFLQRNAEVVGPHEALDVLSRGGRRRYVLLTFDDGYRDNYEIALPILRSHNVCATFFLTTGFVDGRANSWWDELAWMVHCSARTRIPGSRWLPEPLSFVDGDREPSIRALLRTYKSLRSEDAPAFLDFVAEATGSGRAPSQVFHELWITWEMAREMKGSGMFFGGHTDMHAILSSLPREGQELEIGRCAERLRAELGEPMRWFSYPDGSRSAFDGDTRDLLGQNGVDMSFSFYGGYSRLPHEDLLDVPRCSVEAALGDREFRAMISIPQAFCRPWR